MSSSADNTNNPGRRPRIAPLELPEWTTEAFAAMESMRPPEGSAYDKRKADRKQQVRRPNNALSVLAHYPELAKAFLAFNRHLLYFNTLPGRAIELVVLRVAWLRRSEYEWVQHSAAAIEAGLTYEEIDRTAAESIEGWAAEDALLLKAVDELHNNHRWSDAIWSELAEAYDTRQIMDLLFTVGAYGTLAVAFNCFDLPLDPELEGKSFPADHER